MATLHMGTLAHLEGDPFADAQALTIVARGGLLVERGRIAAVGEADGLRRQFPEVELVDHGNAWLLPGLIDGHVHATQFYATASTGVDLLDWLNRSIFAAELRFADQVYAAAAADAFVRHLLEHGTTTAVAYGSQFPHALEALFDAAERHGLRLIAGLTLMDRGAPSALLTTPEAAYEQSMAFAQRLRGHARLHYAITPRFALSCTPGLLEACGQLASDLPEAFIQTHINESRGEIEATARAFPEARHYLEVYQRAGLLRPHTVLAHCIHTTPPELALMAEQRLTACHCPCSNLYLGSGLFPLQRHQQAGVAVCVGSDIGAGSHFCLLAELAEVYKVQQLHGLTLDAGKLLYLATLGAAESLGLAHETGNFAVGKSADFFVLDPSADPYLHTRLGHCDNAEQQLFVLLQLAGRAHLRAMPIHARSA